MIVVIPAYRPDRQLEQIVKELNEQTDYEIIVVDDGSGADYAAVFEKIKGSAAVLFHEENRGKGAAIKTALSYIRHEFSDEEAVAFMDGDGQHCLADLQQVVKAYYQNDRALILGSRKYTGNLPFQFRLGQKVTKMIFRLLGGADIDDTRTGLRVVSALAIPELLQIPGNRYEYEMNVLLQFAKEKRKLVEVPIAVAYEKMTTFPSHFRPVWDHIRIYGSIFKFLISNCMCGLLDYVVFFIFVQLLDSIMNGAILILCNLIARIVSAATNYYVNRRYVFHNKGATTVSAVRFAMAAILILCANSAVLYLLVQCFHILPIIAKFVAGCVLFFVNFLIQQRFVFKSVDKRRN